MGGSSKQPAVTTQIQKVELPAWVEGASQSNYRRAEEIANRPYQAYEGQTVAGTPQATRDAWDYILNNMNAGQPNYDLASKATSDAQGLFNKASGGINSLNRSDYENPYIADVVNAALGDLDKSRTQALMQNADAATAAKSIRLHQDRTHPMSRPAPRRIARRSKSQTPSIAPPSPDGCEGRP